ncbi:MAG TPA: hypothetical protein VFH27_06150 [Longimicrobiaceae bacterium]|nr:hypothetical protein [Longimicrobiaceae bacterium]
MSTSEAGINLTPSEQTLVYADQFAPKGSMLKGKENLLLGEGNVAVNTLAEVMLSVAVMALEKAGVVRMQQVTRKSMFGLIKRQVVELTPTGTKASFPDATLESLLAARLGSAPIDVDDLVYAFFSDDMKWPQQFIVDVAKSGLSERGILHAEKTTKLLMFSTVKATVAPEHRAALQAGAPTDARALVKDAESRGTLWTVINKQAASGIGRRTEASDNSGSFSD